MEPLMIIIDNLLELANTAVLLEYPSDALNIRRHIKEWTFGSATKDSFMENFGGHVFILEHFYDFAQITFQNENHRTTNLMCDYGAFDQCEYLDPSATVVIHQCTSNSGGPVFYVPKYLVRANPFVELSIAESN
jgi:hypothetical protein